MPLSPCTVLTCDVIVHMLKKKKKKRQKTQTWVWKCGFKLTLNYLHLALVSIICFFFFFCIFFVLVRRMWVIRLPLTLAVKGNLLLLVSQFMLLFMFLLRTIHEILFQLAFRQCRPKA